MICNIQNIYYNLFENIVHEITHIIIEEPVVEKFQLEQFEKEGVIEWLFLNHPIIKKIFPNYTIQKHVTLPDDDFIRELDWNF